VKYYIIAGEASGDMHGGNLMKEIKNVDSSADFRFWGGEKMQSQGGTMVKHYRKMAFMGFVEVLLNIRTILGYMRTCKEDILSYQPDVVVLIDYPGFNMRIAEFAKNQGIKVAYYISPQIWAWKKNRVFKLKKTVDSMLTILPFEKAFYADYQMEVQFVGHPLLDSVMPKDQWIEKAPNSWKQSELPIVALLPGSRKQEIQRVLPVMLESIKGLSQFRFVLAMAPSQEEGFYKTILSNSSIELSRDSTYTLLSVAKAALVTSGTATLETALFQVPQVVCYKGSAISFAIAKQLVKIPFISLVNLVVNKEIVKELIQNDLTADSLRLNLLALFEKESRIKMLNEYNELAAKLGGSGASARAAEAVCDLAKQG
jgi:lipid-A-disaccharide synthase